MTAYLLFQVANLHNYVHLPSSHSDLTDGTNSPPLVHLTLSCQRVNLNHKFTSNENTSWDNISNHFISAPTTTRQPAGCLWNTHTSVMHLHAGYIQWTASEFYLHTIHSESFNICISRCKADALISRLQWFRCWSGWEMHSDSVRSAICTYSVKKLIVADQRSAGTK